MCSESLGLIIIVRPTEKLNLTQYFSFSHLKGKLRLIHHNTKCGPNDIFFSFLFSNKTIPLRLYKYVDNGGLECFRVQRHGIIIGTSNFINKLTAALHSVAYALHPW